ncbi:MAG TPA: hypothetical protein VLW85_03165 [Myxococcales bacterium]|nr:hypothetical protein [Myxococcales bacterium]
MKTRAPILLLALAVSCSTKNENASLVITKVIPPTATVGTEVSCAFDPAETEFTPNLPFNPAENRGIIAAVVQNNMIDTSSLNTVLRTDSNTFLPHQVVVTYEVVGGGVAAPPENIVPTTGVPVPTGTTSTVGFDVFNGINMSGFAANTFIRTTFHVEGKLLDGSTVHTAEREYLFQICTIAGCGLGGTWAAAPTGGGAAVSCF